MEWDHKGIKIAIGGKGQFVATLANGKRIEAPSIDSIKKKIDKESKMTFEPFNAISIEYGDTIIKFKVVRVEKSKATKWAEPEWQFVTDRSGYNKCVRTVILDNPDNRLALERHINIKKEIRKKIEALNKEENESARALPHLGVDAFIGKLGEE